MSILVARLQTCRITSPARLPTLKSPLLRSNEPKQTDRFRPIPVIAKRVERGGEFAGYPQVRRATGAGGAGKPTEGHIKAEIHVKGSVEKAVVKTRGAIEASLHRWPRMSDA